MNIVYCRKFINCSHVISFKMSMEMFLQSGNESNNSDSDTEEPSPKRRCDHDEEPSTLLEGSDNPSTSTVPSPNEPNPEGSHNDSETPGNNQPSSEPVEDQGDPNANNNPSEMEESHNDSETPGNNQPSSELVEDQGDPNANNNPSEMEESHNDSETPGNNQPSSEPVEDQGDPNANNNNPNEVNIKLTHLLPPQVPAQKLRVAVDLSNILEDYFNEAVCDQNCHFTPSITVCELDLTLPSSYESKLVQDANDQLALILVEIIAKTCQSKVAKVVFPKMRIDLLRGTMRRLKDKFTEKNIEPQFDEIMLPFLAEDEKMLYDDIVSVIDLLLAYKPKEICLVTDALDQHNTSSVKKLREVISAKIPEDVRPRVNLGSKLIISRKENKKDDKTDKKLKSKKLQKQRVPASKSQPSRKRKLLVPKGLKLQTESQVFAFDFHLMVPLLPGSPYFTAYSYWKLETIHNSGFTGKGITVAVVDTGISPHKAFPNQGNIFKKNFSHNIITTDIIGHGTLCAGILCGKSFKYYRDPQNESDDKKKDFPCGVAPDATLVVCKVTSGASKTASPSAVAKALQWISNENIDVVSLSMGSLGISLEVVEAINHLVHKGVIIVCAASNYGHQFSQPICFPARLGHVLCIGSHGPHGKPSSFSPVGQDIDFLAPGEDIAGPNNKYVDHVAVDSGTSYAAPAVAGLVCLILEYINAIAGQVGIDVAKQFKNHWVMKEILRKISTCPGRHTDDEGFGALNPLQFFLRPDQILKTINDEIINPIFMEFS